MSMFCYQCEQTAKGTGCTVSGVCGKSSDVSDSQDMLTCELIGLAAAAEMRSAAAPEVFNIVDVIVDGLFTAVTNVSFDADRSHMLSTDAKKMRESLGGGNVITPEELWSGDTDLVSLRSTLLLGMRGMAAYAHHARVLGKRDPEVDAWFIKGMASLPKEKNVNEWLTLILEFGGVNLKCMALLDEANTGAYGSPVPVAVPLTIEKGPFIVITGHDLRDLKMLLEQTDGRGVNVYTHCEMLPAHAYPELKKHSQLKGNFGTAWQSQQKEFESLPAPVLFTTNCLMPPKASYSDRVYTTSLVAYPGMKHISGNSDGSKDFSEIIEQAIKLGGYSVDKHLTGINGGESVTTGFGHKTVLDNAGTIIDAVKAGAIKHFFLVGGCDGAKPGRNYYTEFVKQTPSDTVVLTLACGKFRFNDLDMGKIGPFPRILDMGQCNDAYSAIQVASALAGAFGCGVNDLPLTLVLSWFEQKAVCILLTLLSLGIKNIYIGPTLPAFLSPAVLNVLIEKFSLHPITSPEEDLREILGR